MQSTANATQSFATDAASLFFSSSTVNSGQTPPKKSSFARYVTPNYVPVEQNVDAEAVAAQLLKDSELRDKMKRLEFELQEQRMTILQLRAESIRAAEVRRTEEEEATIKRALDAQIAADALSVVIQSKKSEVEIALQDVAQDIELTMRSIDCHEQMLQKAAEEDRTYLLQMLSQKRAQLTSLRRKDAMLNQKHNLILMATGVVDDEFDSEDDSLSTSPHMLDDEAHASRLDQWQRLQPEQRISEDDPPHSRPQDSVAMQDGSVSESPLQAHETANISADAAPSDSASSDAPSLQQSGSDLPASQSESSSPIRSFGLPNQVAESLPIRPRASSFESASSATASVVKGRNERRRSMSFASESSSTLPGSLNGQLHVIDEAADGEVGNLNPDTSPHRRDSIKANRSRRASMAMLGLPPDTDLLGHRSSPASVDQTKDDASTSVVPHVPVSKVFQQEMMGRYSKRKVDIETQTIERGLTSSVVQELASQGYADLPDLAPRTLFIFDQYNVVRKQALRFVLHPLFDKFMLFIVLLNSVLLASMDPTNPQAELNQTLNQYDVYFTAVFCIEMVARIISFGAFMYPTAYLRSGWNCIDCFVCIISILGEVMTDASKYQGLRALRVLKILRVLVGIQSMRAVVSCIFQASKPLKNAVFVFLFLLLIFAIVGLNLFSGNGHFVCFNSVTGTALLDQLCGSIEDRSGIDCPNGYECKRALRNVPAAKIINFDNIFLAILAVFSCFTQEGWTTTMQLMEYVTPGFALVYFHSVTYFFNIFVINLVLAILKVNLDSGNLFKAATRSNSPELDVTGTVRKISDNYKTKEISPDTTFFAKARRNMQILVETNYWAVFFLSLVIMNTIVLACQYADMPVQEQNILDSINAILTHIFAVEVCLKIVAFGVKAYFLEVSL